MRRVVLDDALEWCDKQAAAGHHGPVVTSPPDAAEVGSVPPDWEPWFRLAIDRCLGLAGDHPAIFYVTDRRYQGSTVSKAQMVLEESGKYARVGQKVLWHKIAQRRGTNATDIHRPTFSHMIAVGGPSCRPGAATPDVFPRGNVTYPNGMGDNAACIALGYLAAQGYQHVYNPFCGSGTVLAVANHLGLSATGVDNDVTMVARAQMLTYPWGV